ncbi:MAG: LptF/LptG family permease, partial [Paracoccaceae bacterium]
MKLDLYFARRFLATFGALLALFFMFYALLDMVEQLRQFDADQVGFLSILHLTALNVPSGLYRILPLIVILATITLFLNLARKSELVVTRAAGRSALRSLVSPVLMALVLGVLAVAMFNPIVAATTKQYETVSNRFSQKQSSVLSISKEGLWLRQGDATGQTVIRAERANLDGTHLFSVSFVGFSADGTPSYRVEAEGAELTDGAWVLSNAKRWDVADTSIPEQTAATSATLRIPSDLTRDQIRDSFGSPSAIPIWELPAFIDRLERAGFSARQHRVWLQMELAL